MTSSLANIDALLAFPRLSGLTLSPDGRRLVTSVATLRPDATKYVTSLWEVDPTGEAPARRLTRSLRGETTPLFAADGTLLFTSQRPDPDADGKVDDDAPAALWQLPPGGEARLAGSRPGGLGLLAAGLGSATLLVSSDTLPGSGDGDEDAARRTRRKDRTVTAVLHAGYPVRHWDADLGPGQPPR